MLHIRKTMAGLFAGVILMFCVLPMNVSAEGTTTIHLSSNTVAVGEKVSVNISATASDTITLKYDNEGLKLVGGSLNYTEAGNAVTYEGSSATFEFTALAEGKANVIVTGNSVTGSSAFVQVSGGAEPVQPEPVENAEPEDNPEAAIPEAQQENTPDINPEDIVPQARGMQAEPAVISADDNDSYQVKWNRLRYVVAIMAFVIVVLLVVCINLFISKRRIEMEDEFYDDEDDEDEDGDSVDFEEEVQPESVAIEEPEFEDEEETVVDNGSDEVTELKGEISYRDIKGAEAFKSSKEIRYKSGADSQVDILDLNDL